MAGQPERRAQQRTDHSSPADGVDACCGDHSAARMATDHQATDTQPAGAQTTGAQTTGAPPAGAQTTDPQTTDPQTTGAQTTGAQTTGAPPADAQTADGRTASGVPSAEKRTPPGVPQSDADLVELASTLPSCPGLSDGWLGSISPSALDDLAETLSLPEPGAIPAGFLHADDGLAGCGFAAGGSLDTLRPGPKLARYTSEAHDGGLARISDDELIGVLCAHRRLMSWSAALELTTIAELHRRRIAGKNRTGSTDLEHISEELAAALTLTGHAADKLLGLALALSRLPGVHAALAEGGIDLPRAAVFANELVAIPCSDAADIAAAVLPQAGRLTTGELRSALRRMILALDPDAARRRAEQARAEAHVEVWEESSGNASLTGRELPPAEVIAADKRIDAIARALKAAGADGTMDQLRARVFTALLVGRDPDTLLPGAGTREVRPDGARRAGEPAAGSAGWLAGLAGTINLTVPLATWLGLANDPGEAAGYPPVDAGSCRELAAAIERNGRARWCVTVTDPAGRAVAHGCARSGPGRSPPSTQGLIGPSRPPGSEDPVAWARSVRLRWLELAPCTHQREKRRLPAWRCASTFDQSPASDLRVPGLPAPVGQL